MYRHPLVPFDDAPLPTETVSQAVDSDEEFRHLFARIINLVPAPAADTMQLNPH